MEKAPEYCLMWIDHWSTCMSRSDWATWSQAVGGITQGFGAVLALGVALWLAYRTDRKTAQQAVDLARAYGAMVRNTLPTAIQQVHRSGGVTFLAYDVKRGIGLLTELQLIGRDIPIHELTVKQALAVIGLRAIVADVIYSKEDVGNSYDYADAYKRALTLIKDL